MQIINAVSFENGGNQLKTMNDSGFIYAAAADLAHSKKQLVGKKLAGKKRPYYITLEQLEDIIRQLPDIRNGAL